ncbi:polyketide synthase dehydratase domain-containing protein, partial [Streptomyces sp. NPDC047525]|uniref:polyketide synthase dehydratase domain-containing protein n=1 Tax=Streptomyces sp. NPDC047525 TaxID=3155264 RepID=UPI0033E9B91A
ERELGGRVQVAAVNGPRAVVVSGEGEALDVVARAFEEQGRRVRRLRVSHAFHSHLMEPMLAEFGEIAAQLTYHAPTLPVISNVSGQLATAAELTDPGYWVRQVRGTVRFHQGITTLAAAGVRTFAEIGPRGVLTAMVTDCLPPDIADSTVCVALSRTGRPETTTLVQALARLWTTGTHLDWHTLTPAPTNQNTNTNTNTNTDTDTTLQLPTYAFDRHPYWLDRTSQTGNGDLSRVGLTTLDHGLLAASVEVAGDGPVVLSGRISTATHPWLADHAVAGTVIVPGTAFVDLAIRAGDQVGCALVEELLIQQPLVLPDGSAAEVQVVVDPAGDDGRRTAAVLSRAQGAGGVWIRHAQITLAPDRVGADDADLAQLSGAWPPAGSVAVPVETLYADLAERGYHYGPVFQGLKSVWRSADPEVLFAEVTLPEHAQEDAARFGLHPALLDAALHALQLHPAFPQDGTWLPFAWNHVTLHATNATTLHVTLHITPDNTIQLTATDPTNTPVVQIGTLNIRPADTTQFATSTLNTNGLYALEWMPVAESTATPLTSVAVLGEAPFPLPQATAYTDTAALLAWLDAGNPAPQCAIVSLTTPDIAEADVLAATHQHAEHLLLTVQAWLADERLEDTPLIVHTRRAITTTPTPHAPGVTDLPASIAWGLIRTAQTEHPDRFILLDTDTDTPGTGTDTDWTAVLAHAASGFEPQLAHHDGTLLAARLVRGVDGRQIAGVGGFGAGTDWRVDVTGNGGTFDDVGKTENPRATRPLEEGEIRLQVRAAGLNFYDVAVALGLAPSNEGLGTEGAGVVVETGPGVTRFAVGDRVFGGFPSAFAPLTIADERTLAPMPEGVSFQEAATIPTVFLTAYYGLRDLAGLQPGERVLIHAAAGGVGMAAVQLARLRGADIYATASPAKWPTLHAMGIDDDHIANSRT